VARHGHPPLVGRSRRTDSGHAEPLRQAPLPSPASQDSTLKEATETRRRRKHASERALRTATLGRKNYLFVGNDQAGQNIAGLHALVAKCTVNGVNPFEYLADVLPRLAEHPVSRIDEILPQSWTPPGPS
jgi:hypothetical protein